MLALALGCGGEVYTDGESEGCSSGSAGCPCVEDGACEDWLACVDGVCTPGAGNSTTSAVTAATTSAGSMTGESGESGELSTSAGATSTGASATTEACEFICEDSPKPEQLCDLFAQDCPEGSKCAGYDSDGDGWLDSVRCVPVTGDGQHGEPCVAKPLAEGGDDCGVGVQCWYLDDELMGACVEMCSGTPARPICSAPATSCPIPGGGGSLNLCLPTCDPLLQDCWDNALCIPVGSEGFVCVQDDSGGMAPEGTPCEYANRCNPGLLCVNPDFYPGSDCQGSLGCCAPFCDTEVPGACIGLSVAEAECVPFYAPEPAPEGLEHVGLCGVPW